VEEADERDPTMDGNTGMRKPEHGARTRETSTGKKQGLLGKKLPMRKTLESAELPQR